MPQSGVWEGGCWLEFQVYLVHRGSMSFAIGIEMTTRISATVSKITLPSVLNWTSIGLYCLFSFVLNTFERITLDILMETFWWMWKPCKELETAPVRSVNPETWPTILKKTIFHQWRKHQNIKGFNFLFLTTLLYNQVFAIYRKISVQSHDSMFLQC